MEVKNLLSVVIAALTALGAMLFAMGSQSPWLAMALWMAAVVSLVVTDFLGVVRIPRKAAIWLLWGVQAIFSPYLLVQSGWDGRMQTAANILIYSQLILLFQEKDARTYGWLAVMSLLQAVVAARYSQGVAFGGLIITYTIVGIFALSLLVLYSQWGRHRGQSRVGAAVGVPPGHHVGTPTTRWPLAAMQAKFTSAPAGSGRSGVVTELFARLALIAAGALFLAAIIFSTVPRPPAAWRGETRKPLNTVGFSDQITLGGLGDTIENRQEVMQLKLMDPATSEVYPMRDDVYLRGSVVTWYSQNQWRREPPPNQSPVGNALRGVPGVPDERPLSPSWNATEGVPYRRGTRRGMRRIPTVWMTMRAIRHYSASALPWCRKSPWSRTWLTTIYSISGRWWNPSETRPRRRLNSSETMHLRPVYWPTWVEAHFQRRSARQQFQVRSADQRAGRRTSGPADSSQPRGTSFTLSANAQRSLAFAPADGLGRAMAERKWPAIAQTLRCRPLVRETVLRFRPVPLQLARRGSRHFDGFHRRLRFQSSPRTLRVLCHGPGLDAPQPGNTSAGRIGLSLRRMARGPTMLPGPPVARARLGRGVSQRGPDRSGPEGSAAQRSEGFAARRGS